MKRLTKDEIKQIKKIFKTTRITIQEIADNFSVSRHTIHYHINKKCNQYQKNQNKTKRQKEYRKEYNGKNKEKIRKRNRQYYLKNKSSNK